MSPSGRGFSLFALACATGNVKEVEALLKAVKYDDERTQLLECRESALRIPPFLLTIALAKRPGTVNFHTLYTTEEMDFRSGQSLVEVWGT